MIVEDLWSCFFYSLAFMAGLFLFMFYDSDTVKEEQSEQNTPKRQKPRRSSSDYQLKNIMTKLGLTYDPTLQFQSFCDHFKTFEEVSLACRKAGLMKCNLILGLDFTASNEWQGRKTFNQCSLHKISSGKIFNPYQKVIWILGKTLAPFRENKNNHKIPCFGFGDSSTLDKSVFHFKNTHEPCDGIQDVLNCYNDIVTKITLSGPTNFAPVIKAAINIVQKLNEYHILVIIADGQVTEEESTIGAIVEASNYPLSIIVVGVGDGPWDIMNEFDNRIPQRKFDNFQFVDYHKVTFKAKYPDSSFALQALMEIPDQYKTIKYLGYIKDMDKSRLSSPSHGRTESQGSHCSAATNNSWFFDSRKSSPKGSPIKHS